MISKKLVIVALFAILLIVALLLQGFSLPREVELTDLPQFSFSPVSGSELLSYVSQGTNFCLYNYMTELMAAVNKNPEICRIKETQEDVDKCLDRYYFFSTVYGEDSCGMISDADFKLLCLAVNKNDASSCSQITPSNKLSKTCTGILSLDTSSCSSLLGEERTACTNLVRMFIAKENNDISQCDSLVDFPGDMPGDQRNFCMLFIQRNNFVDETSENEAQSCIRQIFEEIDFRSLDDRVSCNSISDSEGRIECGAVVSGNPDECSEINTKSLKFRCYFQILGKERLEDLCETGVDFCIEPDIR